MMIKLSKEAERKAKLAASKAPQKVAQINLSTKWINWLIVALLAFQVYLNIAAYNAMLAGMNNFSLFLTGLILLVFAGMFHVYRYGMSEEKKIPTPPPQIAREIPKPIGVAPDAAAAKLTEKESSPKVTAPQETAPEIKTASTVVPKESATGTPDLKKA